MYLHRNDIYLKKIDYTDLELLLELKSESWFGTHNIPILNMRDQNNWFNKINDDHTTLILKALDYSKEECSVGIFKINHIDYVNRQCDVAYDVFKNFRNLGYGYKLVEAGVDFCFEILNLNRLNEEILSNNIASQKVSERAGFVLEGNKRRCIYKLNKYIDSRIYGILKDDWTQLDRVKNYNYICHKN